MEYNLEKVRTNTSNSNFNLSVGYLINPVYGMTECGLVASGADLDEQFIPGNVGPVVAGLELKVIDLKTGESLGPNTDGEICIKGKRLFAGYLNEGEISYEAFDSEGWYRTGDIGHYDEKEYLFITDRVKEVMRINYGDHLINISPVEIEHFLLTHKSIAEVAVVGVFNRAGTHCPRAYVVLKQGHTATDQEVKKFVAGNMHAQLYLNSE